MRNRFSITLVICMIGAAISIASLAIPPREFAQPPEANPNPSVSVNDQAAAVEVSIANFAFSTVGPVAGGTQVVVTNRDSAPHTLTGVNGEFDTGLLDPGATATITLPSSAGDYAFFCEVHPSMTGIFTVSG